MTKCPEINKQPSPPCKFRGVLHQCQHPRYDTVLQAVKFMGIWVKVTQDLSLLCLITKGIDNDFKINSLIKKKKRSWGHCWSSAFVPPSCSYFSPAGLLVCRPLHTLPPLIKTVFLPLAASSNYHHLSYRTQPYYYLLRDFADPWNVDWISFLCVLVALLGLSLFACLQLPLVPVSSTVTS